MDPRMRQGMFRCFQHIGERVAGQAYRRFPTGEASCSVTSNPLVSSLTTARGASEATRSTSC